MIHYAFKEDAVRVFKDADEADPQVLGEAISAINDAHGGHATIRQIEEAVIADEGNPLRKHLTWDDKVAGAKWRRHEIRSIIRTVEVVGEAGEPNRRAFYSVPEPSGRSYRPLHQLVANEDYQVAVLQQAKRDLDAFRRRYVELTEICEFVDLASAKIEKRLAEGGSAATAA